MSAPAPPGFFAAQRDANVAEIITELSDLAYSPSKFKASETREIVHRARQMLRDLHVDLKGWEAEGRGHGGCGLSLCDECRAES